ncbi:MAG: helix-turn-helix domain-containing protein [Lentisphaeria bacterium]|nr:helix-turn-helix domain-containing protein [Lentisphaeria bacterium]
MPNQNNQCDDSYDYLANVWFKEKLHGLDIPVLSLSYKDKKTLGKCHYHNFHELTVIMSGHGEYVYQGNTYHLQPGDAYITPPMVKHQYTQQQNLEVLNFLWYPNEMPVPFSVLENIPCFRVFFDLEPRSRHHFSFTQRLVLSMEQLSEVRMYFLRMTKEREEHQQGYSIRLSCIFYEMLIQLCRWYSTRQNTSSNNELTRIEKVMNYLNKHYMEHISRPEIARMCSCCDRSFAEMFKKVIGETFSEYLMKVRLNNAKHYLLSTDKSLGEIAMDCGFCDSNYLCFVFRKKFGISPHQFRLDSRL